MIFLLLQERRKIRIVMVRKYHYRVRVGPEILRLEETHLDHFRNDNCIMESVVFLPLIS